VAFLEIFKVEQFKGEIKNLKLQFLKDKEIIENNELQIAKLKKENQELKMRNDKYNEVSTNDKFMYNSNERFIERLNEENKNFKLENEKYVETIACNEIDIAKLKDNIREEKDKYIKINQENANLKLENEKYKETISCNELDIEKLKDNNGEEEDKNIKINQENANLKLENEKYKETIACNKIDIAKLKDNIVEEKDNNIKITQENVNLKYEYEKQKEIITYNNGEIAKFKKEIEENKEKFIETHEENEKLKLENQKYEQINIHNENEIFKYKEKVISAENLSKEYKVQNMNLKSKIQEYENILNDESYYKVKDINKYLCKLENDKNNIEKVINTKKSELNSLLENIKQLEEKIIVLDDEILYQSFGLYIPLYEFVNSDEYKEELELIRVKQKEMLKSNRATSNIIYWGVDSNVDKDPKLVNDNIKQIIRCFNGECESIINKVKFNNIESIKNRVKKSYDSLNKINRRNGIEISEEYLNFKFQELNLAYEYNVKKQEEKEERRRLLEEKREESKLLKELEEKRRELEKEKMHYDNVMKHIEDQIKNEQSEERLNVLLDKKSDIENNLCDVDKALKEVDYREANYKAGYVYVISNIGAFGENVYKIGMTRRIEPQDRIDELGSASVPFKFDVHAMIFSDDAPKLESAIHRAFEDEKVNVVNGRKEFFNVRLEEVEKVVKANYDKSVNFIKIPEAQQYRESLKIREDLINTFNNKVN